MNKQRQRRLAYGFLFLLPFIFVGCKDFLHPEGPSIPDAPAGVTVAGLSSREIRVSWNAAPRADAYQVYYGTEAEGNSTFGDETASQSINISGLIPETEYYVTVKAGNRNGWSKASAPVKGITSGEQIYTVTISALANGAITASPPSGAAGTLISLTITPDTGYRLKAGTLKYNDGADHDITGSSFNLPAVDVRVSAEFELIPPETYTVTIGALANGVITASPQSGIAGTLISLTITPETGYGLKAGTLKYNDDADHDITGSSFTLPAANVTVSAEFELIARPAAPSAPTVTPGDTQLTISWMAVAGASAYEVWIGTSSNTAFASKCGEDITDALSTTISGLTNETTYYVWVNAKNQFGTSGFSPMVRGTPAIATTPPAAPGTLSITAGDQWLTVSWQPVVGADSYDVYYGASTNQPSDAQQSGISGLSTTITGLSNGTTYNVWVKAQNVIGSSDFSPVASGKPLGAPGPLTVTSGNAELTVSWTAVAGADSYDVYYGTSTNQSFATQKPGISGTSTTITDLTNGTAYYVWIKAKNANGTSGFSSMASGTPLGPPAAPGAPTVTTGNGQLRVSWPTVARADSYDVYYGTDINPPSDPAQTVTTTSAIINSLSNGTTYYVWIKANNEYGGGGFSPRAEGKPMSAASGTVIVKNKLPAGAIAIDRVEEEELRRDGIIVIDDDTVIARNESKTYPDLLSGSYKALIRLNGGFRLSADFSLENGQTILITVTGDYYHEVTLVVTTISVPSAPGTPTVSIGSQQLTVSWASVVGVDQYEVYYSTGDNPPASPAQTITDTPTTINDLTNGTTYYVWIKAKNDAGTSGFSPAASGTPLAPPLNIQAVPQSPERILVSWEAAAGGVSYKVYRSNTSGSGYTLLSPSSTNSYMDTSPSGGTTYYYKVSTVKGSSESELSAPVSATTRIGTSIAITLSQNDVDLSSQTVSIPRGQSRSFQVTESYATYQWYLNGDAISGATSASYTLDTSSMKLGVYELSVIVNAGTGIPLSGNCYVRVE